MLLKSHLLHTSLICQCSILEFKQISTSNTPIQRVKNIYKFIESFKTKNMLMSSEHTTNCRRCNFAELSFFIVLLGPVEFHLDRNGRCPKITLTKRLGCQRLSTKKCSVKLATNENVRLSNFV